MPRFTLLLVSALTFLIVTPLLGVGTVGVIGGKLLLTVMLWTAAAELPRRQFRIGVIMALLTIGIDWVGIVVNPAGLLPMAIALRALFFLYVASVVLVSVVRQRTVTFDTIAGASCVYLFLGFMWAMLFALLDHFEPSSIRFPAGWVPDRPGAEMAPYIYFSFVTLATLGYGDIVPATVDATGLVVAEAVIGQLYLTILIARLVGLHLTVHREVA